MLRASNDCHILRESFFEKYIYIFFVHFLDQMGPQMPEAKLKRSDVA